MATPPASLPFSPTVAGTVEALGDKSVPVREIVELILSRHRSDYAVGHTRAVSWPTIARSASVGEWLSELQAIFRPHAYPQLHGRAVILGLAILDSATGRQVVASGLFGALANETNEPFATVLADAGVERLGQIPLAGSIAGLEPLTLQHDGLIHEVLFSPDARFLATACGDHVARVWDVESGQVARSTVHAGQVTSIAFSPDGTRVVSGSDDGAALIWDARAEADVGSVRTEGAVQKVAFSPDGTIVAIASSDSSVRLVQGTGEEIARHVFDSAASDLSFSADGTRLVAASQETVHVLSGTTLTRLGPELRRPQVWRVATDPAGQHAILAGAGAEATVWRPDDDQVIATILTGGDQVASVAFSADGLRYLAAGRDVQLGTMGTTRVARLAGTGPAALSRDGGLVAAVGPPGVHLSSEAGFEIATLAADSPPGAIALSADTRFVAAGSPDGSVRIWPVDLGERDRQLPDYSPDDASGEEDLLGIDRDVIALAMLIAARRVDPPLAIGIFGDWGSGKSFFIRRLESAVAQLASASRASGVMQKEIEFYKHVVQVEFNAWHYAQGELWPSLVETIFANLRLYPGEPPDAVDRREREILEKASLAELRLTSAQQKGREAELAVEVAERERNRLQEEVDAQTKRLAELRTQDPLEEAALGPHVQATINELLASLGLGPVGESARELAEALAEARLVAKRGGSVLTPLARAPDANRRIARLALFLFALPILGGAAALLAAAIGGEAVATVAGVATSAAALVSGVAAWVRRQAAWTEERLDQLDEARREVEKPVVEARVVLQQQVVEAEQGVQSKQAQLVEAQTHVQSAQRERAAVQAELEAATPARLRAQLIQDRVESGDYRKYLGVLALIRRDFSDLSDFLSKDRDLLQTFDSIGEEDKDAAVRINRIVLYIDDLDRCEPEKVVEVLKAVHLLLAFPLFVVVVGVDVRWVLKSLRTEYSGLLVSHGGAAPEDYLEKIFQVPLWLERLSSSSSTQMLRGLLARPAESATETATLGTQQPVGGASSEQTESVGGPVERARRSGERRGTVDTSVLNPKSLEIGPFELEAMEELSGLLRRSPRTLKRFVNIYRLIKARVDDLDAFLEDRGSESSYRAVLFLLGIANALPSTSGAVMTPLLEAAPQEPPPWDTLDALVQSLPVPRRGIDSDERETIDEWLRTSTGWAQLSAEELIIWAPVVARFSFRRQERGHA
jgi:WD40 repeat protein